MSNPPVANLDLEALELQLLPAWAQQSPSENRFTGYEGRDDSRGRRGDSHERRDNRTSRPPRRDERGPGARPGGRPDFNRRDDRRPMPGGRGRPEPDREPVKLPEVQVAITPEEKGAESLARQIKLTGRAYPVFDIAQLILKKPERFQVRFSVVKKPDGQIAQAMWLCQLDDTIWLSEEEATDHVLRRHFGTFYQAERTPTEPQKGTYTFVGQCGLSGVILGPPNYHDYQNKLHKLHTERFSRMPFDVFKSRVRIVRDEAVVKQWVDEQSWKTEFVCLNIPEAQKLANMEEVAKHFREVHLANIIRPIESHSLSGQLALRLPAPPLRELARREYEDQRRFPLKVVTTLSQFLASQGLHFFKVRKSITHVSVARPRFLDLELTPVSTGIRRIVELINATPRCTRRTLLEALAPVPPATVAEATAPADPQSTPAIENVPPAPTPEQNAVIGDLHWLIHEGHVIEFSNGVFELAKRPLPRPPKPEPSPAKTPAATATSEQSAAPGEEKTASEPTPEPAAEIPVTVDAPADLGTGEPTPAAAPAPTETGDLAAETDPTKQPTTQPTTPPA